MKKISIILLNLVLMQIAFAQNNVFRVCQSGYSHATYSLTTPKISFHSQSVDNQTFQVVELSGASPSTEIGRPDLPVLTQMIELPLCEDVSIQISDIQTKLFDPLTHYIMPVQPAPCKSDTTPLPFAFDSIFYATSTIADTTVAWVEKLGIGRDRNLGMLRVKPVSYNPATGEIQVITSMTITLTYHNADVAGTETLLNRYYSPDFAIGNNALLTSLPKSKTIRNAAPLHYLIVAHSSFRGALDEFVSWKKRQGFLVTTSYTDDPGVGTTSTEIAAHIKSYYTNATDELPAPTYLLLVGDVQQIPPFNAQCGRPSTDHITDLYYATWTDGDHIPDCYMGRFSANTVAELTPQIEKTLFYQRYEFPDDSYLGHGVLIAGEDSGYENDNAYRYADPAMDYIAKYYVNASNGYSTVHYYKNNFGFSPAGVHVDGSSQTTATTNSLISLYNQGCGWINYSAHGYDDSWSTPRFTTTNAGNMTNYDKPSFMIGNCCLSGRFNTTRYNACLGEALLRKGSNAGAVGYIGGTNSTYWPHDFCWAVGVRSNISNNMDASYDSLHLGVYDRLFHTHNESYSAWHTTAGSINVAGNTAVQAYGSYTQYYWEIYELFGDPSLMPWLGPADAAIVECSDVVTLGEPSLTVHTDPYAYVALTYSSEYELVTAAYADANGYATLELPSTIVPETYELAVWSQNRKPFFKEVNIITANGPYVMITRMQPSSSDISPDSIVSFDIAITNVGNEVPTNGLITLTSSDPGVTIIQPEAHFNSCNPGDTIMLNTVWPIYISGKLTDGQKLSFTATVDFGPGTSIYRHRASISAPKLAVSNAKSNPALAPDSAATITCRLTNNGSMAAENLDITLVNDFGFIAQAPDPVHISSLAPDESLSISFYLRLNSSVPSTTIPFYLYAANPSGRQLIDTIYLNCGSNDDEDFETGDFSRIAWTFNDNPWEITAENPYDGTFSARSKSSLANNSESRLSIIWDSELDDSISFYYKVSSEPNYDFFYFFIDGVEKVRASGTSNSWTRASIPVPAGRHILAFSYTKDYSTVRGEDCAHIDNIKLPFSGKESIFITDEVCHNTPYQFSNQTLPTGDTGIFNYSDTTATPWQYLSLSVVSEPEISILKTPIPNERCFLLQAHGTAKYYVWNTGDTADCIAVCPTTTTTYTVTGFNNGCSAEASTTLLAIDQADVQPQVSVYPNPTRHSVTVQSDHIRSIELVNLMGQTVLRKPVNSGYTRLDMRQFPDGVYFIRVNTSQSSVVRKLIKK